jgi:hypothetical protein
VANTATEGLLRSLGGQENESASRLLALASFPAAKEQVLSKVGGAGSVEGDR